MPSGIYKRIIGVNCGSQKGKTWKVKNTSNLKRAAQKRIADGVQVVFQKGYNLNEKHPRWKGDNVKYGALHEWLKKRIPKPNLCEDCKKNLPYDLANKTGIYNRDLKNWEWLCRKCHMDKDGRNERLRQKGKNIKLPNKICLYCKKTFHRTYGMRTAKYCSQICYFNHKRI